MATHRLTALKIKTPEVVWMRKSHGIFMYVEQVMGSNSAGFDSFALFKQDEVPFSKFMEQLCMFMHPAIPFIKDQLSHSAG